jgi:hypothetical protein
MIIFLVKPQSAVLDSFDEFPYFYIHCSFFLVALQIFFQQKTLRNMAIWVVEFSNKGYKTRQIFA